jgi:hypothetical protein
MAADQVRINGFAFDWGSIIIKVEGLRFTGFDAIDYPDKLETEFAYGQGRAHGPIAQSKGKYTPGPGKLRGLKSTMQALRAELASRALDGRSYGTVRFTAVVQYIEDGNTSVTDEVLNCRLVGNAVAHEEAPGVLKEECEITFTRVIHNGVTLYDSSEGLE